MAEQTNGKRARSRWVKLFGPRLYIVNGVSVADLQKAVPLYDIRQMTPGQFAVLDYDSKFRPALYGRYEGMGRGPIENTTLDYHFTLVAATADRCENGYNMNKAVWVSQDAVEVMLRNQENMPK